MEINFAGKTALVTGAGKGIGRATSKLLSKCGANVIALTRTQSDLDSLKEEIPNLQTICVDLANLEEAIKAVEAFDNIDLLVNNAALITTIDTLAITQEQMEKGMLINVIAPLRLSQVVFKNLKEKSRSGAIVNISSVASRFGLPKILPYACTKAALESVTRVLAAEGAQYKIRVNALCVGATDTPALEQAISKEDLSMYVARIPMRRMAEAEEVAETIAYLLSDKASYITGQCVTHDGGFTMT